MLQRGKHVQTCHFHSQHLSSYFAIKWNPSVTVRKAAARIKPYFVQIRKNCSLSSISSETTRLLSAQSWTSVLGQAHYLNTAKTGWGRQKTCDKNPQKTRLFHSHSPRSMKILFFEILTCPCGIFLTKENKCNKKSFLHF